MGFIANVVRRQVKTGVFLILAGAVAEPAAGQQPARTPIPGGIFGSRDQRTAIDSTHWPWSSIGRLNILMGMARGYCTGTLIGKKQVLTAAHCLFDQRTHRWVEPHEVHFVAGQSRDRFQAHAIADHFVIGPNFSVSDPPHLFNQTTSDMMARDWAVITLDNELPLTPIEWRIATAADLRQPEGEFLRAGYGADRPYLLSIHRPCSIALGPQVGLLLHRCDSMPGDSGSPILWHQHGSVSVVGIHAAVLQDFKTGEGFAPLVGFAVSAAAFDATARQAVGR